MLRYDVVVVGGGSTGSSIAFYLGRKGVGRILLLDKSCFGCGQTSVSSAIVRTQYSHPEARKMAVYSWRFLREEFREATGCEQKAFYETGVAYGVGVDGVEEARRVVEALRFMDVPVEIMEPEVFAEKIHPIETSGLELVTWEPQGGYGDPHTLVTCMVEAARRMGVEARPRTPVAKLLVEDMGGKKSVHGVVLEGGERVEADTVVVAVNVWVNKLLSQHGLELPISIAREDVVVFSHPGREAGPVWADLVLGFYSRMDSRYSTLVGGLEPEPVEEPASLEPGHYTTPPADLVVKRGVAAKRLPYLADARPRAAWYGFYDVSPDWQPLLGPDPRAEGLVLAVGLSGHGFKLAPAIGDIVSDIVVRGKPRLVDPAVFAPERLWEGRSEKGAYRYAILG